MPRRSPRDLALGALVVAYFAAVVTVGREPELQSSAEDVGDGRLWLLFTSALSVDGEPAWAQILLLAAVAVWLVARESPLVWWAAALAGHVLSALSAYALIGIADGLGSEGAERAADDPDFGISCVLAGTLGALLVSGLRRRDTPTSIAGALGLLGLVPVSFGWYGIEHVFAYGFGALAAALLVRPNRHG